MRGQQWNAFWAGGSRVRTRTQRVVTCCSTFQSSRQTAQRPTNPRIRHTAGNWSSKRQIPSRKKRISSPAPSSQNPNRLPANNRKVRQNGERQGRDRRPVSRHRTWRSSWQSTATARPPSGHQGQTLTDEPPSSAATSPASARPPTALSRPRTTPRCRFRSPRSTRTAVPSRGRTTSTRYAASSAPWARATMP